MNRIRRLCRSLIRPASPPSTGEPRASQLHGQGPVLASGPGRDGLAAWFSQDLAEGASVTVGQDRPAPTIMSSRWRTRTTPRLVPHTIQLCIHCRHNPAGFWVSYTSSQTARRPWCLSCCQDLDPRCHHIKPFDS